MSGKQARPALTHRSRAEWMEEAVEDKDDEIETPVNSTPIVEMPMDLDDEDDVVVVEQLPGTSSKAMSASSPFKLEPFLHVDQFHQFEETLVGAFQAVVKREYATAPWLIKQLPNHKYRPTFLIINCEEILEQKGFPNGFKARSLRTFETFQYFIQVFGGDTTRLPDVKTREAIPLLFPSQDFNLNEEVVQAWQKSERKSRRIYRDIYNGDKFIAKILQAGKMVDLGEFVIGQSFYEEHDINDIVHGVCRWDQLLTKSAP